MTVKRKIKILLVAENASNALLISKLFEEHNFDIDVKQVETEDECYGEILAANFDAIVCELEGEDFSATDILFMQQEAGNTVPLIVFTEPEKISDAHEAISSGAFDYVLKGDAGHLYPTVINGISMHQLKQELESAQNENNKLSTQLNLNPTKNNYDEQ